MRAIADAVGESEPAIVVHVLNDYKLAINRGLRDGLKSGQRFLVYGIGDELTDPISGESLGNLEIVRGVGRVVHLQERLSTLETDTFQTLPSIKRRTTGTLDAILGRETIEDLPGEREKIPFEEAKRGDFARPI